LSVLLLLISLLLYLFILAYKGYGYLIW